MERKKKYKLNIEGKVPIHLLGILSDETDLKLSWLINQNLLINLSRDDDLNWLSRELPNPLAFPVYSDLYSKYGPVRLLKNRTLEGLWIKGYKQVDYLFMVISELDKTTNRNLLDKLQATSNIRGIYSLDPGPLEPWMG